jgi:hypothetical protein
MKNTLLLVIISAFVLNFVHAKEKLNAEFLEGFETGLLVRNDPRAFKDYNCPVPDTSNEGIKKLLSMIGPMKMVINMTGDSKLSNLSN